MAAAGFTAGAAAGAGVGASMATGVGVVDCTVAVVIFFFATVLDAVDFVAGAGELVDLLVVFLDALIVYVIWMGMSKPQFSATVANRKPMHQLRLGKFSRP
jgi:hypothetical protein